MNDTGHFPISRLRIEGGEALRISIAAMTDEAALTWISQCAVEQLYELSALCDEEPATEDIHRCVPCWAYIEAQKREDAAKATPDQEAEARTAALETVCEIAFAWAGEYGFSDPEQAKEVWDAAKLLRPDLEPDA